MIFLNQFTVLLSEFVFKYSQQYLCTLKKMVQMGEGIYSISL